MTKKQRPGSCAQTVREIIENNPILFFRATDSVTDVISELQRLGLSFGGVVDLSEKFIGMITEHEIVRKAFGDTSNLQDRLDSLAQKSSADSLTAWDVMIANPNSLQPETSVEGALDIITSYGYRCMPVVDFQGRLLGIVDAVDLHRHVHEKAKAEIKAKDSLLSYFLGSEPYGIGASI